MVRRLVVVVVMGLVWAGVGVPWAAADPSSSPSPGLLDEAAAMALARRSGIPVEVSAKTDEFTVVTADPVSGSFVAELSARPARVRDGAGGWRAPSARLVLGADGLWRTEAGLWSVRVSNGGSGPLVSLGDVQGRGAASLAWPEGVLPVPVVEGATATFAEVYPGVDLVVRADVDAVSTFLLVKTAVAGRNPRVRSWTMPLSLAGLRVKTLANGVASLVDAAGVERVMLPPATMWDSSGKETGLVHAADRLEEIQQTRASGVGLEVASSRVTAIADASFLDDPATVYPVVIDPTLQSLNQTHVLRVTDDWSKWDSDVGSVGKVGYNGWTSPYYRSRMFYQFSWPTNDDGTGLTKSQIKQGVFQYKQVYSTQWSPCPSTSTAYPAVRAKLATAIASSDTWFDRTEAGGGWHPQASVRSGYLAVGNDDHCSVTPTVQSWDLTGALQTERQDYDYRGTVTVGLFSDDEAEKLGWKYFSNSDGSSPKLLVTYQRKPATPTAVGVSTAILAPGSGYTDLAQPSVSATVGLSASDSCWVAGGACVKARFKVKRPDGSFMAVVDSAPVTPGSVATAVVPEPLQDLSTYSVEVSTVSTDTGVVSAVSTASFTTRLPINPGLPTALKVANGGVESPDRIALSSSPSLKATLPATTVDGTQLCPAENVTCLSVEFSWWKAGDGQPMVPQVVLTGKAAGQNVTATASGLEDGTAYQVQVKVVRNIAPAAATSSADTMPITVDFP